MKAAAVGINAPTSHPMKAIEEEKIQLKIMKSNNIMAPVIGQAHKTPGANLPSDLMMGLVNKKQP